MVRIASSLLKRFFTFLLITYSNCGFVNFFGNRLKEWSRISLNGATMSEIARYLKKEHNVSKTSPIEWKRLLVNLFSKKAHRVSKTEVAVSHSPTLGPAPTRPVWSRSSRNDYRTDGDNMTIRLQSQSRRLITLWAKMSRRSSGKKMPTHNVHGILAVFCTVNNTTNPPSRV